MLRADHIHLSLRRRQILQDVSLRISPGKFTVVVGPNGAGKSTIIKVLSGEMRPALGTVTLSGIETARLNARAMAQVRAVLPQQSQVHFGFSAEQVVLLGRQSHLATRKENSSVVDEVMDLTGTTAFKSRIYHTLSGGERQRVQLARVLAQVWEQTVFPRFLLLDEPTSSLDIAQQEVIFSLAKVACSRNIGVLAIIHDLNHAVQFADEMVFLRGGRCLSAGMPSVVFTRSTIEETFGCPVSIHHIAGYAHPIMVPLHGNSIRGPLFQSDNKISNQ